MRPVKGNKKQLSCTHQPGTVWANPYVYYLSCKTTYTLGKKNIVTPSFEAIQSIWIECLCFQWAEIEWNCICDCSPTTSDVTLAGLSLQWQLGSFKSKIAAWVVSSPKFAFALWQVRISNCMLFISYINPGSQIPWRRESVAHVTYLPLAGGGATALIDRHFW